MDKKKALKIVQEAGYELGNLPKELKKDKKPQPIDFGKSITGRYVKVKILSEVNGGAWASAAEIGFIGKPSE